MMKAKHVFTITGLSLAMAATVLAGRAFASKTLKADAVDSGTVIYLDLSGGDWSSDNAKLAIWNHQASQFEEFAEDQESGLWKVTLSAACTSFNLFRGSTLNWDDKWNQSDDASFEDGKNKIVSTGYSGNKLTFSWGTYTPLVDPEYHLLGSFNSWEDENDEYLFTVDSQDSNHYVLNDVELEENDELKVCDVPNDIWYDNGSGNIVVAEDGTYDIDFYVHVEYGNPIVLTKQVVEPVYTVSCRNGSPVEFVLDEEDKPEGVVHQYSASVQYAARAGSLVFYRDGTEITSGIGVDWDTTLDKPVPGNNVYGNTTDGFRIYHTNNHTGYTKIYLKTYSDGGLSVWGEGYAQNTFYAAVHKQNGSSQQVTLTLDTDYEPNETYIEQYKTSSPVALKALAGTEWATSNGLSDSAGLSEDLAPEAVANNNAMQAFQSTAWKVHNDCTENIYVKVLKVDLSLKIFVGGYEEAHVMTIGGQNITLHKANENEYYAEHVALSAGDTVTAYSIEGTPVSGFGAKVVGNNNLGEDLKVIVDNTDASIYYNVNTKQIHISGLPLGGYHIIKNGTTLVEMTAAGEYEGFNQYKSELIEFAKDDSIKFVDTNGAEGVARAVVFSITKINAEGLGSKFEAVDGVVKAKEAVEAKVYLKLKSGQDEIYFGEVDPYIVDAKEFVDGFKSALAGACSAEGKKAAVEAAWGLQATAFAALEKEAQDEIKLGHLSSVSEIREFAGRYLWFLEESGYTLSNFLEWDINPAQHGVSIDSNNTAMLFAVIGAVSLVALASVIVLKKKKANR